MSIMIHSDINSTIDAVLDQLIDETNPDIIYIGWAPVGTASSTAGWAIKRYKKVGSVTYVGWANSSTGFGSEWDDRATLTYSQG